MRGSKRGEPRLDPVRWRRPGRRAIVRFGVVAALVATAAVVLWAGPDHTGGAADPPAGPGASAGSGSPGGPAEPRRAAARPGTADEPISAGAPAGPGSAGAHSGTGAAQDGAPDAGRPAVPPGFVGVPIRLAEPTALTLVHVGDHVDVFRLPEPGRSPQAIAAAALVLGVTGAEDPTTGGLLLALTPAEARRTVTAPGGDYAVLIRPDG